MIEIEFSILAKQCLDRRIADIKTLRQEIHAWVQRRNQQKATVTPNQARDRFAKHYPIHSILI